MFETVWTAASNILDFTVETVSPWAQRALTLGTKVLALQSLMTSSHHNTSWSPDLNYPSIGTANAMDLISAQQAHFLRGSLSPIGINKANGGEISISEARVLGCSNGGVQSISPTKYVEQQTTSITLLVNRSYSRLSSLPTRLTLNDPSVGQLCTMSNQCGSQITIFTNSIIDYCTTGAAQFKFTPSAYYARNVVINWNVADTWNDPSGTFTLTGIPIYIPPTFISNLLPLPSLVMTIAAQATQGSALTGYISNPHFETVTPYFSARQSSGALLPSWLNINSATGQLSGAPQSGHQGAGTLSIYLADGNNATQKNNLAFQNKVSLSWSVNNRPPALQSAIPNQNLRVYDPLDQTYSAASYFNDPDSLPGLSDLRSMSVSGVPTGLNVTQVDALTIRLERAYVDGSLLGPTILFFKVKDSQNAEATATAIINVQGSSALSVVGELQYQQDAGFVLSLNPSTSPRLNITTPVPGVRRLIVRASPQAGVLGSNVFPGVSNHYDAITGTLTVTMADEAKQHQSYLMFYPAPNVFSNIPIRFDLEDGVNAPVGLDTVIFGNRIFYPFVLNQVPAPVTVFAGDRLSAQNVFANAFSNRGFFPVNYTVDSGLKPWMQFDPLLGNMVFTPRSGDQSVNTLMLRVTQQGNASHTLDIPWSVTVPNRNPVLFNAPPPQSVARGGVLNLTLPANTFVDPDGDALVLDALSPPNGTQLTSLGNGTMLRIVYPTGPNTPSSLNFVVRGTDAWGAYASSNMPVTVETSFFVNGVMNDQVGLAGYDFDVLIPTASSALGADYTVSLQTATGDLPPHWIRLRNDAFYHLNGTVPSTDTALYSFQLLYDDQHGSVQRLPFQWRNQIALNLYAASSQSLLRQNQASARLPSLGVNYPGNENVTVILEVPRLFAAPQVNETLANLSGLTPSRIFNPETDNYEWRVSGSKEAVNTHLDQVPLTLTRNYFGSTQVVMRANNGKNQVALVLAVTVTHLNQPPVLQVQVPPLVCTEGQTCSLTVPPGSFYDPDVAAANDRLSILSGPLPANTVFDAQTSTYTMGAPPGTYQVQPTAVDLAGLTASMNITITMNPKPPRDWVGEFRSYAPSFSGIVILGPLSMALLLWCVRLRDWQKSRRALDALVKKELVARYAIYKEKLHEKEVSIRDLDAQLTIIVQQLKGEITPKVLEDVRHFAQLVWLYVAAHYNNPTRESVFERRVIRKLVQLSQSIAQSIRDHCADSRLEVYASLAQSLADYLKLELTAQYRLLDVEEKLVMWNELSREVRKSWYQRFWARSTYLISCGYCGISSEKDMLANVFRVRASAAIVSRLKDNGTLLGMLWRVLRHGLGAIPPAPNLEDAEVDRIKVLGLFAEVDPNCRTNLIQGYLDCPITQPQRLMAYRNVLEYLKVFAKAESVRDQAGVAIKQKASLSEKSSTGSLHKPGPGRYDKRQVSKAVTKEGSGLFKVPSGFQRPLSVRPRSSGSSSKRSVASTELSTPNSRSLHHNKMSAVLTVVRTPSNSSDSSLHSESSDEGLARESKQRFVVHNLLTEISIQPSTRVGFAPLQSQIPQKEKALFGDEFLPSRDNPLRRGSNLNATSLFCASQAPQPSVSTVLSTIGARFGHKTPVLSSQRKFG